MLHDKKFWLALATLVGTIIGVGIFSLPYLAIQTSFWLMLLYLISLGAFAIIMQLVYGEIVLKTPGRHQISGYAARYLGMNWKKLTFAAEFLAITGILTAYLIIGGDFLYQLLGPYLGGSLNLYIAIYFILRAALVFGGIKSISQFELGLLLLLGLTILVLFVTNISKISWPLASLGTMHWLAPYGAVLFSLFGATVIPEVTDILGPARRYLKTIIISSVSSAVVLYLLFIITVGGLSGAGSTPDALFGLHGLVTPLTLMIFLGLGVITTGTAFIGLGGAAERALMADWHLPRPLAWLFSCALPPILYLLGARNFISIISLVGAVFGGGLSIILLLIYLKVKRQGMASGEYSLRLPDWLVGLFILILLGGVASAIVGLK
ncbi:hypothetical protein HY933_01130 [Candidatus Falkowbacteria bacterium]|nr:hypothetical protein [Candidatus Falkowbacteria bacterium]